MALIPVTIKLSEKEINYIDHLVTEGAGSRSSVVRRIILKDMEERDLERGSAWTEVNHELIRAQGNERAKESMDDFMIQRRISMGLMKRSCDGTLYKVDPITADAIIRGKHYDRRCVSWIRV